MSETLKTIVLVAAAVWGGPMLICAIPLIRAARSIRREKHHETTLRELRLARYARRLR